MNPLFVSTPSDVDHLHARALEQAKQDPPLVDLSGQGRDPEDGLAMTINIALLIAAVLAVVLIAWLLGTWALVALLVPTLVVLIRMITADKAKPHERVPPPSPGHTHIDIIENGGGR